MVFFSDFQYGFKSSRSNCIFLFADCGFWFSTCLVPLELEDLICQIFSRGWHCGLTNKRKCFGSYIQISGFISSFLSINRLRVISVVKFSEGYSFDVGVLRAPFLAVLFYINDLPVVCNIPIYVWWYYSFLPNMIGLPICINSSNWLLNLILQDIVYCCRKWFINFSAKKTVSFKSSNNIGMKSSRHFSILLWLMWVGNFFLVINSSSDTDLFKNLELPFDVIFVSIYVLLILEYLPGV